MEESHEELIQDIQNSLDKKEELLIDFEEEEIEEVIHSDIEEQGEKEDDEQEMGEDEEGEDLGQEGGEVESHDHKEESGQEKEWDKRLNEAMGSLEESLRIMNNLLENSSSEKDESKSPDESAARRPRNKSDT